MVSGRRGRGIRALRLRAPGSPPPALVRWRCLKAMRSRAQPSYLPSSRRSFRSTAPSLWGPPSAGTATRSARSRAVGRPLHGTLTHGGALLQELTRAFVVASVFSFKLLYQGPRCAMGGDMWLMRCARSPRAAIRHPNDCLHVKARLEQFVHKCVRPAHLRPSNAPILALAGPT
jgi:hypothetical protein